MNQKRKKVVAVGDVALIDPEMFPHFKAMTGVSRPFLCDVLIVGEIERKFHADKLAADNKIRNTVLKKR